MVRLADCCETVYRCKNENRPTIHIHSQITQSGGWVVVTANKNNKAQQILSKLIQFSAVPQVQFQAGLKRLGANTDHLLWVNCNLKTKTPIPSQLQCSTTLKVVNSTKNVRCIRYKVFTLPKHL